VTGVGSRESGTKTDRRSNAASSATRGSPSDPAPGTRHPVVGRSGGRNDDERIGEDIEMPDIVQNELIFRCAGCGKQVSVTCLESLHMPVSYSPFRVKDGKTYCDKCWKLLK